MSATKLSVILPVYNGMPFLKEAITSLLNQSYQNFVVYVIDNGSDDGTSDYLNQVNESKINYVRLEEKNLVKALNTGLKLANTPFIARMDADDIIYPSKFEKQIFYFEKEKDVDLIGTLGCYISSDGKKKFDINLPITHNDIICTMLKTRNAFIHPSIMFRREIIARYGNYNNEFFPCEDYELFLRIGDNIKFANIPERLYSFRVREGSIMTTHFDKSIKLYHSISKLYAHKYGNKHIRIEQPENFHLNLPEKLDVLSVSIYRKGLYYYLNVNSAIGMFYFIVASMINPSRLINALKRRIILRTKINNSLNS